MMDTEDAKEMAETSIDQSAVAPVLEADIPFADLPAPRRRSHQDGKSGAGAFIPTPPKLRASHEFPY